ncbi:MAG: copper transporter [Gammaproteobacteria bacterium HGW-Gammaproteobacteria-9]|uniref:CopD family protein n=1 Tax=Pseudomonas sp. (strain SCT) TaxID=412955 RepID=UPI00085824A0|nr:CopD family protein [Pseudomonas sp. SCT]MCW8154921.1 copper transporter [Stutzerimonas stutzeri]OCX93370.1 MAG: copper transporter [Pseudomonas sp. CO183]PKL97253.1 MAG: copper transporter [Gammaproteobacteria bacterium HGW-Gammaproteobacteria-9]GCA57210.1 copper resistance protein D [Pseudomonas sp. SCT]
MRHLLFLHLLGASVWVGGHLVLLFSVLPGALRRRDVQPVRQFEQLYERVGIPALLVQIVSGLWLASLWLPHGQWFDSSPMAHLVQAKLVLLGFTALLGAHARLALIPKLDAQRLPQLGLHIVLITLTAVAFVWVGSGFRFGGLF